MQYIHSCVHKHLSRCRIPSDCSEITEEKEISREEEPRVEYSFDPSCPQWAIMNVISVNVHDILPITYILMTYRAVVIRYNKRKR